MTKDEVQKIQKFMQNTFGNKKIDIRVREKDDSAEVYIGDEFLGVLFVDDEDDERSFQFQMAILDIDLEEVGAE